MTIIADENLHAHFIKALEEKGYQILSIAANFSGITDAKVIETAQQHTGILITEDKDFGELVFAHGIANVTIVFLRYRLAELAKIKDNLLKIVEEYLNKEGKYFVVITSTKIRIRSI